MKRSKSFYSIIIALIIMLIIPGNFKISTLANTINGEASPSKEEFRGVWVATAFNVDWPSKKALSIDGQKKEITNLFDGIKDMSMNAVIFQVRATGDAFYPSNFAPWSEFLTGTLGKSPGYDPLKFALEEARKRNLEFHAWVNPFRISTSSSFNKDAYINSLPDGTALKRNPQWIVKYGNNHWINPGIPEARDYVINTVLEIVKNYDIDAIHIDDYFYPYPVSDIDFPDGTEFEAYGKGYNNVGDWRRDNINFFIRDLSARIKSIKSYVKFGVSPFGIWRNKSESVPNGSDTNGLSSYDRIYTDSVKWINENYIDYIIPQIYWNFGYKPAAYEKLVDWWVKQVQGKKTDLYIGHAAYKVGDGSQSSAWLSGEELPNQIKYNRTFKEIKGSSFFSIKDLMANRLNIKDKLINDLYKYKAIVPSFDTSQIGKASTPELLTVAKNNKSIEINWKDNNPSNTSYYIIYRSSLVEENIAKSQNIIGILRKDNLEKLNYIDNNIDENQVYYYGVSAVNRVNVESNLSNIVSNSNVKINSFITDKVSPQNMNTPINIRVDATGNKLLYRFLISNGDGFRVIKDYSSSNQVTWSPSEPGKYTLKAEIKEENSIRTFDASISNTFTVKGNYKIFIDAGHGGSEPGATGFSGMLEKEINLKIATKLNKELSDFGIDTIMARTSDVNVDLSERAKLANDAGADLFISIHQNSFSDPSSNGIETYYFATSSEGGKLASFVQDNIIKSTLGRNRGVKTANFVVLRESKMPAILIECGFISNEAEEQKLIQDEYQNKLVDGIVLGVKQYLAIENKQEKEDINKDGKIDILDLAMVSLQLNTASDSPLWNKNFDFNNDNIIDIFDLVLMAKKIK